jgi:hypothetical protein
LGPEGVNIPPGGQNRCKLGSHTDHGGMLMAKPKKCANPACSCVPADGAKYCSAHCEGIGDRVEVMCRCGHPECAGDVTNA